MGNPLDPPVKQIVDELNLRNAAKLPEPLQAAWFAVENPIPIVGDALYNTKATLRMKVSHPVYKGGVLVNYSRLPLEDVYSNILEPLLIPGGPAPLTMTYPALAALIDAEHPFDLVAHIDDGTAIITTSPKQFTLRPKQFSDKFVGELVVTASFAFNGSLEYFLNATTATETRPNGQQLPNPGIVGAGRVRYWNATYENGMLTGTPQWVTQLTMGAGAFALPDYFLSVMGDANGLTAFVHPEVMAYTSLNVDSTFQAWKASNPILRIEMLNVAGQVVSTLTPKVNSSVFDNGTSIHALMFTDYNYIYTDDKITGSTLGYRNWPADPAALHRVRVVYYV